MYHAFRLVHTNNKIATEDDLYGVVLASSSYLYTLGKFSRRRNRQTGPRLFRVQDVLRRRDDLGEYARLVQELPLDSAWSHGYVWMSTEQFDYVLRTAASGTTRHVHQLCRPTWQCT